MEHSDQTADQVRAEFLDHRFGATYEGDEMAEGDVDLFAALLDGAVTVQVRIDQLTDRALVAKWPIPAPSAVTIHGRGCCVLCVAVASPLEMANKFGCVDLSSIRGYLSSVHGALTKTHQNASLMLP